MALSRSPCSSPCRRTANPGVVTKPSTDPAVDGIALGVHCGVSESCWGALSRAVYWRCLMGPTRFLWNAGFLIAAAACLVSCGKASEPVVAQQVDLSRGGSQADQDALRAEVRCCERFRGPLERLICLREAERGIGACRLRHDAGMDAAAHAPEAGVRDASRDQVGDGGTACNPATMSCNRDAGRDAASAKDAAGGKDAATAAAAKDAAGSGGGIDAQPDGGPSCVPDNGTCGTPTSGSCCTGTCAAFVCICQTTLGGSCDRTSGCCSAAMTCDIAPGAPFGTCTCPNGVCETCQPLLGGPCSMGDLCCSSSMVCNTAPGARIGTCANKTSNCSPAGTPCNFFAPMPCCSGSTCDAVSPGICG